MAFYSRYHRALTFENFSCALEYGSISLSADDKSRKSFFIIFFFCFFQEYGSFRLSADDKEPGRLFEGLRFWALDLGHGFPKGMPYVGLFGVYM